MFANDTSGLDEKFGGRPGPAAFYAYYRSLVPTRAAPDSVEAVKTVVCVREAPVVVGIYKAQDSSVTKEIAAVRLDWHVRVLNWPSGETIASTIFQGGEPPSAMSRTTDRMYPTEGGLAPSSEAEQWIDGLIAQ
ncbi:hypothetical protein [uncultured Hyphomicrobium sp.]|uniref:hypothetical protein n=1 Tax=uncultured Hyphomicrobium sp. TaxID=194373 RepID=UPI0025EC0C85|nr:hypothetical protein [uncultured Hyphomicrobium sp.]